MHQSHHEWCSCGKYRSHGIQVAGAGGGRRSPSRKRRQFSKASDTVVPWTCTLCNQEVTTKACSVCGLRKSYLEAAQHVKLEKVTPNHVIKLAPRIACRPQVPAGTGAPEFYKKQLKALQTMRKNAIILEDTALTASLEQRIAQTKRLCLDARPLSEQLSTLVQTKEKKRLAIVAIDKDVCAASQLQRLGQGDGHAQGRDAQDPTCGSGGCFGGESLRHRCLFRAISRACGQRERQTSC